MKAEEWKVKIKEACVAAETYKPCFEDVIDTLAAILQERDAAMKQYVETGSHPVISYTNKAGASNPSKNPCLLLWNDLNTSALAYWRDLGLTPSGLKKINDSALKPKKRSALAEALRDLEHEK